MAKTFHMPDAGEPVLAFCASRKQTQSCAELLAELLRGQLSHEPASEAAQAASQEARKALVMQMQDAMGGFSNTALEKLMLAGLSCCLLPHLDLPR